MKSEWCYASTIEDLGKGRNVLSLGCYAADSGTRFVAGPGDLGLGMRSGPRLVSCHGANYGSSSWIGRYAQRMSFLRVGGLASAGWWCVVRVMGEGVKS